MGTYGPMGLHTETNLKSELAIRNIYPMTTMAARHPSRCVREGEPILADNFCFGAGLCRRNDFIALSYGEV